MGRTYRHPGFQWEAIAHIRTPSGEKAYSVRLSQRIRAVAYRDGDFCASCHFTPITIPPTGDEHCTPPLATAGPVLDGGADVAGPLVRASDCRDRRAPALVPAGLELDTFEGQAWIGVVPFRMTGIRPVASAAAWLSAFAELNVRTYVTVGGKPGVCFFSLDAANPSPSPRPVACFTCRT